MKKQQLEVRNLILMLSSAVFVAFVAVILLVYFFGSGDYFMRQALIAPHKLEKITFTDYDPPRGKKKQFEFSKIEFVSSNMNGKGWARFDVPLSAYAAFYDLVWYERSVPVVTQEMFHQFDQQLPSTLTIFTIDRDRSPIIFQEIQFLEGSDIFRVQLRKGTGKEEWAYFRFPGIYKHAIELFVSQSLHHSHDAG